ncbi:MAG: LOG family protein [Ignavibacteriaceae bacterium]
MDKVITVFGSAQPKEGEVEFETAYNLGSLLAKNNFNVCTGGFQGTMNAVSKGAMENGAEAIGVTVDLWSASPSKYLTKEIKCSSLFERISKLVELGDAYIILQGGTGTLLELAVVWEMMNKKIIDVKPAACHSSMWKGIVEIMDKQLKHENRPVKYVESFNNIEEIVTYIKSKIS